MNIVFNKAMLFPTPNNNLYNLNLCDCAFSTIKYLWSINIMDKLLETNIQIVDWSVSSFVHTVITNAAAIL